MNEHTLCIAPMMEWTDRHFRYFVRLMSRNVRLYTEMITSSALVHGDRERLLQFSSQEHPIALQIGGSNPREMALAAKWGSEAGYDEININVGCPSDRVQSGRFGVCLMKEPQQVGQCVTAMQRETELPVSVKCRIGVDEFTNYGFLENFINTVAEAGCNIFIIHARSAWLQGLNPKQNREIPELNYQRVYQLKNEHPNLSIVINGGIETEAAIKNHLDYVDGVMIGRKAYKNPTFLLNVDQEIFGQSQDITSMESIIVDYTSYVENNMQSGVPFKCMAKHLLNAFQNIPGAKQWRRHLSENMHKPKADTDIIFQALTFLHEKYI